MNSNVSLLRTEQSQAVCREIEINNGASMGQKLFPDNYISTTKYNLITLLPRNLFEQFHRLANIWFLLVSILQLLPFQLSPTSSWATITPLSLVITVTLIKDAYMDYRRYKNDRFINNKNAQIWDSVTQKFIQVLWKDIEVGNLILIKKNEQVASDTVLIVTSDESGACYISTSNLDGESNLKHRCSLKDTQVLHKEGGMWTEAMQRILRINGAKVKTENPNNRLYTFYGSLKLLTKPTPIPIDNENIILRGSTVKNIEWCIGLVVFTGKDTKIMMNSKNAPSKRSFVERRTNYYLFAIFTLLFFITALSTLLSISVSYNDQEASEFFAGQDSIESVLSMFTFLILYNGLVPISLYVTMDMVRVIQGKFMEWDINMYQEENDQPIIVRNTDINEDLGQIEYIFTDKTGTLTENQMEFKQCSVGGKIYGVLDTQDSQQHIDYSEFKFFDPEFNSDLQTLPQVQLFVKAMALCHTIIPQHVDGKIEFQGISPDEQALVIAAHCFNYSLVNASSVLYGLSINGEYYEYEVLGINNFDSTRKRMSIVLRCTTDKQQPTILFCKGADSNMLEIIDGDQDEIDTMQQHLLDFSMQGLRTLVYGYKELTEEEVAKYEKNYNNAKNAMANRQGRLDEVASSIEDNIKLLGVTAINDRIQDGVAETIDTLRKAGINFWMLTGDKVETAENIAYSCKLLTDSSKVIKLKSLFKNDLARELSTALENVIYEDVQQQVFSRISQIDVQQQNNTPESSGLFQAPRARKRAPTKYCKILNPNDSNNAVLVDGQVLEMILSNAKLARHFLIISLLSSVVICCRVSPLQKSRIVSLVKNNYAFKPMTLAIGDGGNDVSMIQTANVGIGVIGREGLQAVNASDYALARFKYLQNLLLQHGRLNYIRISKVILYSFYKNFLMILPMFYFNTLNMYSGTALYDSWLIMSYNVAWTALPIVVLGIFDKDIPCDFVHKFPRLYQEGLRSYIFNFKAMIKWIIFSILQSFMIFIVTWQVTQGAQNSDGNTESLMEMGTSCYMAVVGTATLCIALEMHEWNAIFLTITSLSWILLIPSIIIYDKTSFPTPNLVGATDSLFQFPWILIWLFAPFVCFLLDLVVYYFQKIWNTSFKDYLIINQKELLGKIQYEDVEQDIQGNFRALQYQKQLKDVFVENGLQNDNDDDETESFMPQPVTLEFKNQTLEKQYKEFAKQRSLRIVRILAWMIFLALLIWTIADSLSNDPATEVIAVRIIVIILVFIMLILFMISTKKVKRCFEQLIILIVLCGVTLKLVTEYINGSDGSMVSAMIPITTIVIIDIGTYKMFIINLIYNIVYFIRILIFYSLEIDTVNVVIIGMNYIALLTGITIVCGFVGYVMERARREEYVLIKALDFQLSRTQDILSNLLPEFVKDRVKEGDKFIAEPQQRVTILFCDIYSFDNICATHQPDELLELLDNFFAVLDTLCEIHGVTKIETVNKTYMACAGITQSEQIIDPKLLEKSQELRIVELALDIIQQIQPVYLKTGDKLQVKIGINSGPVITGVVGYHKPQFSLMGDTVNTSSRMCSTIKKPDQIQISSETYSQVKNSSFVFEQDQVEAKGKGLLTTYYVTENSNNFFARQNSSISEVRNSINPIKPQQQQEDSMSECSIDSSHQNLVSNVEETNAIQKSHTRKTMRSKDLLKDPRASVQNLGIISPNPPCLTRNLPSTEKAYIKKINESSIQYTTKGLWMTFSINGALTMIFMIAYAIKSQHGTLLLIVFRMLFLGVLLAVVLTYEKWYQSYYQRWVLTISYSVISIISMASVISLDSDFVYIVVLEVMYMNVIINHISNLFFFQIALACLIILISYLIIFFTFLDEAATTLETSFFLLIFIVINTFISFLRERQVRNTYNLELMANHEIDKHENLLSHLMPSHVLKAIKDGVLGTDLYRNVTILYADICGFTNWSSDKRPIEVVSMLSELFTTFDHLCVTNFVYKVHTIGDCYVILGQTEVGPDGENRNSVTECYNVVKMALDMIKSIRQVNQDKGLELDMRIGIHTGDVVAGITGTSIVRYDIYGPDNDIANKMESGGAPGQINVSEVTKKILEDNYRGKFHFEFNKVISHKPVDRDLESWFLTLNDY